MSSFFNSWYFVVIILGTIFIFCTRKSWNEVIKRAAIEIKNKFLSFKSTNQEQQKVKKADRKPGVEEKRLRVLYKNLGVGNFDEFDQLFGKLLKESYENKNKLNQQENSIKTIFTLWKFYMFSYLKLYLVPNSKLALLWLYNNPNQTKDMFQLSMFIPQSILTPIVEKEAIFNALISHNLIFKDIRDLYSVSNIGKDFLGFEGLMK